MLVTEQRNREKKIELHARFCNISNDVEEVLVVMVTVMEWIEILSWSVERRAERSMRGCSLMVFHLGFRYFERLLMVLFVFEAAAHVGRCSYYRRVVL